MKKATIIKFAGLIVFVLLLVVAFLGLWPHFGSLSSAEGRLELIALIQSSGALGWLICLGLQFLQIVVAFIPGEVIQIAIGSVYGTGWGSVITFLGAALSSAVVFAIVRWLGRDFVEGMVGKREVHKFAWLSNEKHLNTLIFILYLIPGLPKDIFNYIFPLSKVRFRVFMVLSTLARIPGIVGSSFIGEALINEDWTQAIVVCVVLGGLGILGIVFNAKIVAGVDKLLDKYLPGK